MAHIDVLWTVLTHIGMLVIFEWIVYSTNQLDEKLLHIGCYNKRGCTFRTMIMYLHDHDLGCSFFFFFCGKNDLGFGLCHDQHIIFRVGRKNFFHSIRVNFGQCTSCIEAMRLFGCYVNFLRSFAGFTLLLYLCRMCPKYQSYRINTTGTS